MAKVTTVVFDRVRDCPHWNEGQCTHVDNWDELCNIGEIDFPPETCPCEEAGK